MSDLIRLEDIERAYESIRGDLVRTPLIFASTLSARFGCEVYLKAETQQRTGSFKDRGSLFCMQNLTEAQCRCGVITASAGNHAQAVAYHAQRLGIPAHIVMPQNTPFAKITRTRAFGAEITLEGETLDDAQKRVEARCGAEQLSWIHPFDDPLVIMGQGSVGLEIIEDLPELDAVIVPVGGGGLISGIGVVVKAHNPQVQVFGVEAEQYASMASALSGEAGVIGGNTVAEGIAVKRPGEINVAHVRALVEELVAVSESALEHAVKLLLDEGRILAEGAGAAGLAALELLAPRLRGKRVVLPVCGANIDMRLLSSILLRDMGRSGALAHLQVEIVDRPGALAEVSRAIADSGANVLEVRHLRMFEHMPVKSAVLDFVLETRDRSHIELILQLVGDAGYSVREREFE